MTKAWGLDKGNSFFNNQSFINVLQYRTLPTVMLYNISNTFLVKSSKPARWEETVLSNPQLTISRNLARLRQEKNLSLDALAEKANVSKVLLCQIEHGEANPTVNTLWKIAVGLDVPFGSLAYEVGSTLQLVRKTDITPIFDSQTGLELSPLFSSHHRSIEIFIATLPQNSTHKSSPHAAKSEEYVLVLEGALLVTVSNQHYELAQGDSLCIPADQPHSYTNAGEQPAKFECILNKAPFFF